MKTKIKKLLCLLLSLVVILSMAAGCGSDEKSSGDGTGDENVSEVAGEENNETNEGNSEEENTASPEEAEYIIEDEVIVDDDNCKFVMTKAETDSIWGFTLKVYCENKTTDKNIMFTVDNVSVNGYMNEPFWAEEVAPGKKSNSTISFSDSSLEKCGITSVDEIIFALRIYDYDDWSADDFVNDVFAVYPTGLSAETVRYPDRYTTSGENIVIDNENLTFVILETYDDSIWGYTVSCYIENKTDKLLMFSWDDVSVNGYMVDPFWASSVAPGMRSYADIRFFDSDFEENGITSVEEIEFTLRAHDYNDWSAADYVNDTFVYNP